MSFTKTVFSCLCVCFFILGCSRKSISALEGKGIFIAQRAIPLKTGSTGHHLQIQYTGSGGLIIRQSPTTIMIDPFFSHQKFIAIGRSMFVGGKIKSKPSMLSFAKKRILDSLNISDNMLLKETKAIFSAHGHYDHLMDIPYIHQYWLNQQPHVYVNESSLNTCSHVIPSEKLHNIEPIMSIRNQVGGSVEFMSEDSSVIKVYPILAAHNPHSRNIKLFSGSVMHDLPRYNKPEAKTNVNDWLEGRTLSFLIDIEKNEEIVFRMFVQSSTCHFPDGLPAESLLEKRPVDLAVMGIASYQFSEASYPCKYLGVMQPRNLMFIHWEDFFRSYKRKPKSLMKNNIPAFFAKCLTKCKPDSYMLPVPGVVVNIEY